MNKSAKRNIRNTIAAVSILLIVLSPSCKKKNPREKEPNNTFYNSNRLEIDTTMEGFLDTGKDQDFFIIDIQNPMILNIELSAVKGINHAFKIWKSNIRSLQRPVEDFRSNVVPGVKLTKFNLRSPSFFSSSGNSVSRVASA